MYRGYFSKKRPTYQQDLLFHLVKKCANEGERALTVPLFFVYNVR